MTISTTTANARAVADGVLTTFTFTYVALDDDHVTVYLDGVLQGSGYTVNRNADQSVSPGGDVEFDVAPSNTVVVNIVRAVPFTQTYDYTDYTAFPADSHEEALDLLTMMMQQLSERLGRVPSLGVDSELSNFSLGSPVADEVVQYNAAADGLEATGIDATAFSANVAAAAASASAASTSESNAGTSETNAAASESAAAASAAAASTDADDAAAAAAAAGSYVAYGRVASDGTVSKDNGLFTASNDGTGLIGITFDATQNDADYVILITSESSNARTALVVPASQDADGFQIEFENASGTANNSDCFVLCMRADAWLDA